jgi:hypothetical protein
MVKITVYQWKEKIHCVTVEYLSEENNPVFKAYYDEFTIGLILSEQWQDQLKENTGQNIALIRCEEMPDN